MNRLTTLFCWLAVCGVTGSASGRSPLPIDPPTPPPCAADGTCYPNTCEWGYYPSRWRTWPGDQLEPTPSKTPTEAEGRVSPELGHSETPPPELEDAAAPPSSPKREEATAEPPAAGERPPATDNGESSLPNVPLPDAETPSPLGTTSEFDPPPPLPRSLSDKLPGTGQRQAATPIGGRPTTSRVSTIDPPPAPPWAQSAAL
jgi:hypothetical protein